MEDPSRRVDPGEVVAEVRCSERFALEGVVGSTTGSCDDAMTEAFDSSFRDEFIRDPHHPAATARGTTWRTSSAP